MVVKRKYILSTDSSEEYDSVTGVSSIEFYVAMKDPHRAAPVGKIATPWPITETRPSPEARKFANEIQKQIEEILANFVVKFETIKIRNVAARGLSNFRTTMIIITDDTDTENWVAAATTVQMIIDEVIKARGTGLKIGVEIRNPALMYQDVSRIIRSDTAEYKALIAVQKETIAKVKEVCPGVWTSVTFFRRVNLLDGTAKPTVVVTVEPRSRHFWSAIEKEIETTITKSNNTGTELYLEILPGIASPSISKEMEASSPISLVGLPENAANSSSIGAENAEEPGSLGIWGYFQPLGSSDKIKCFLTCYHVVAPGDPANRATNNEQGIALNGKEALKEIKINYPSHFDVKEGKKFLQSELDREFDPRGENSAALSTINKYIDAGGIGTVMHASGNRYNSEGSRMDWAIVRVNDPGFFGENCPPVVTRRQLYNLHYHIDAGETVKRMGEFVLESWVAKNGRTTLTTSGEVDSLWGVVDWHNGMESHEAVIASLEGGGGEAFALGGDLGSMICDLNKNWAEEDVDVLESDVRGEGVQSEDPGKVLAEKESEGRKSEIEESEMRDSKEEELKVQDLPIGELKIKESTAKEARTEKEIVEKPTLSTPPSDSKAQDISERSRDSNRQDDDESSEEEFSIPSSLEMPKKPPRIFSDANLENANRQRRNLSYESSDTGEELKFRQKKEQLIEEEEKKISEKRKKRVDEFRREAS
ncbi:hypothetical protein G7Y89_g12266 [Cudoniella acicularis]|uniref:Uncharacterized protein n=1 Tax=Cudoniella acicularis TaxID=354080 RepID=A0A8H4RAE4_9HELO|nr:hypothetical protein G7Y89_g12266 [Cudoniella acicularis]